MLSRASYFKIGVFVIATVSLIVVSALVLGAGSFLRSRIGFETCFDESVEGLIVGSLVRYRGVDVGEVTEIGWVRRVYGEDKPPYVRVVFNVDPAVFRGLPATQVLDRAKGEGLMVRLKKELVSGSATLEADYLDGDALNIDWETELQFVASVPSLGTQIEQAGHQLLDRINELDVESIVDRVDTALEVVTQAVRRSDIPSLAGDLRRILTEIGPVLQSVSRILEDQRVDAVLEDAGVTMSRARALFEAVDESLPKTIGEMELAVQDLRSVMGHLDRVGESGRLEEGLDAFAGLSRQVEGVTEGASELLERANKTLARVDRTVADQGRSLTDLVQNLRVVTRHLENLLAGADQYPSRLLLGDPPPQTKPRAER